ncbi:MAG: DNA-binding protein [Clostridiales bacterium]|jgi:predicted DNA-binding protein YlxM (UPF0122 family)|nr:DNA-binding protein [Clostridiales bacterium]
MEKFEKMALLLDMYGELLTQKQRNVMDQYYNFDLSLQEIAENVGISKQGVHDLIRRAENLLLRTENKLGFLKRLLRIQAELKTIKCMLELYNQESIHQADQKCINIGQSHDKLLACLDKLDNLINICMGG